MKLFKIIDGAYLGFYQERGGTVFISGYRMVTKTVCDWKTIVTEVKEPDKYVNILMDVPAHMGVREVWVPEKTETKTRTVPGYYETETVYIQGHYETQEIWIPEHEEEHFVEVPGYYEMRRVQEPGQWEIQNIWVPEYYVTRYYWREAYTARGLEAAWIPYQHLIPAGYKEQRVWVAGRWVQKEFWVDATWEYQTVTVPGQYRDHRVWVDGNYEDINVWVPARVEEYEKVIPGYTEEQEYWVPYYSRYVEVMVEGKVVVKEAVVWVCEDVEVEEPIYSYYGHEDEYDLIDRQKGPVFVIVGPPVGDQLQLRIIETGDIIDVEAEYLGVTVRNDDDAYVLP